MQGAPVTLLALSVAGAAGVGILAHRRGRSGVMAFFGSLPWPLVGLVAVLLTPPDYAELMRRENRLWVKRYQRRQRQWKVRNRT